MLLQQNTDWRRYFYGIKANRIIQILKGKAVTKTVLPMKVFKLGSYENKGGEKKKEEKQKEEK